MKFSVSQCQVIRKIDEAVYSGATALIRTNFGSIKVQKAAIPGYFADLENGDLPEFTASGPTPATALLKLCDILSRTESNQRSSNVVKFYPVTRYERCPKPLGSDAERNPNPPNKEFKTDLDLA